MSTYKGRALASTGPYRLLAASTKPKLPPAERAVATLINDPAMIGRAEIIREKGTNRSRIFRDRWINTPA